MSKKISTIVNEDVWNEFKELSKETHQNISGMLTDALRDYIKRRKVRPIFIKHMNDSISENRELGKLLAK
ncbi:MAG: hypothetical protein ABII18_12490 [bacterium]|nr:hypothetical protein [bacterium]MBU1917749.1 hypothetical protein [bacterium]